ncbi:hypothetical protein J7K50_09790 [bacterium]|nr:hypothetical protein [bacterium]
MKNKDTRSGLDFGNKSSGDSGKSSGLTDDVEQLKKGVADASKKPDTTGHLVWIVIVVIVFSALSGFLSGVISNWLSLTRFSPDDQLAHATYYPPYLLNLAEVYDSAPSFTSGLTWIGAVLLLILCLYSLVRRYGWKWVTYLIGLLFVGFYVNALSWSLNIAEIEMGTAIERWQPSLYHIILGAILVMLFAMLFGKRFNLIKGILVFILGCFVLFEIQLSYMSIAVVNEAVASSWATLPDLSFAYSIIGSAILGILLLGGLLLLMEGLAYYDGTVTIKGPLFMMIVVGIPAVFLLWEAQNYPAITDSTAYTSKVGGGVARHYKLKTAYAEEPYTRTAYIIDADSVTTFDLVIKPSLRENIKEFLMDAADLPPGVLTENDFKWLTESPEGVYAFNNIDLEMWRTPLLLKYSGAQTDTVLARRIVEPYFTRGLWDSYTIEEFISLLDNNPFPHTSLRIAAARQVMHHGELVRSEEMLKEIREDFDRLRDYSFFNYEKYAASLNAVESELKDAQAVGPGRFELRVHVSANGKPLWPAYVGLQVLEHKTMETTAEESMQIETEDSEAPVAPAPESGSFAYEIEGAQPGEEETLVEDDETYGEEKLFELDTPSINVTSAQHLLTQFHRVDGRGEVVFDDFISGRYRLIVLTTGLDEEELEYVTFPTVTGMQEEFISGSPTYLVSVDF